MYVDGVLTLPVTLFDGALTGTFASIGNARVERAHRLTLPQL